MGNVDAAALAQLAQQLGLVTPGQLQECRAEAGGSSPEVLARALERKGYLTPWQTHKLLKGDQAGYILGNYRLLYKIASGSFGRVYRADDPRTGKVVAVKVLRRRWTSDAHSIELFEREAKVGLSLRHPNIVSILSMSRDVTTKQYYMVLEFVEGGSLRDFLVIRKKLEPGEALRLLEDAAAGLAYAHSRGVTHRDMKLTNILIASSGTAKLVDFGLAGLNSAHDDEGNVERSVDYAGLEKATNVRPGDVRSDIYFLGCVFYEMLTGRSPLEVTKDRQVRMQRERFEKVPPLTHDEVPAPPAVFQLLETMMSLDPAQRYQTPAQLVDAIRAARREVGDRQARAGAGLPPPAPEVVVFVVEDNPRLQEVLRDRFKELGYRVLLSADPSTAVSRFRQKPFDALVLDAGSVGAESVAHFDDILDQAERQGHPCAGILVLSEEQADRAKRIRTSPTRVVLVRPVTLRQVAETLSQLTPPPAKKE